ncbi:type II secretion system F family protein [Amaricoccus sp.]|uniref:type II secretion system F family protein n=1 Tax=Amaricoccus sp. TaxID=1872485 RepID=UPI001B431E0C|nr:type II secretion system F family protein [Amaricoccus sp.]MBP6999926.1 type II secretion system F family protein [Amaricoccus sp.]
MPADPLADPVAILLLVGSLGGLATLAAVADWLFERRTRLRRVRAAAGGRSTRGAGASRLRSTEPQAWRVAALQFMRRSTQRVSIMKDRQVQDTRRLLVSAGYRGRDAIVVYTFFKLISPFVFMVGTAAYVYGLDPIGKGAGVDLAAVMAGALLGSKLPDLLLKNARGKRLESVRKALPDALDMLVICAEAGLGTDAALKRVVAETSRRASILGEELSQTALELSFMPERRQALENFAERVPLPSVSAFVNTLIQAEKYGTPLARAFKILSQEQRAERMMRAEEKAGRLPATMTVPMMLFILPALFVVLIGPAILDIMDNYIGM